MLFCLGSGEAGHVPGIFWRNKPRRGCGWRWGWSWVGGGLYFSLRFRFGFGLGWFRRRLRRARGGEHQDFASGAIEGALEAAFLAAELIEGAGVGQITGGLGQGILSEMVIYRGRVVDVGFGGRDRSVGTHWVGHGFQPVHGIVGDHGLLE